MKNEILFRFLRSETSPEEETLIADWLDADVEHRKKLDALQFTMEGMALLAPEIEKSIGAKPAKRVMLKRVLCGGAAAAVALLAVVGTGHFLAQRKLREWADTRVSFTVPTGQRINIRLSDGTSVWLNSESTIEYPPVFSGKTRNARVRGEAMFEVAPDTKHPFVVETFAADIKVVGTRFNISAYEASQQFSLALLEGTVDVTGKVTDGERFTLKPNDKISLQRKHLLLGQIDNPDEYKWPEGLISLEGDSFRELMDRFEKNYGVTIIIERKNMPAMNYTGKIPVSEGIDYAFGILQHEAHFTYYRVKGTNEIYIR